MDLRVITSHRSPHIIQYYGSVIRNVSVTHTVQYFNYKLVLGGGGGGDMLPGR